MIPSPTVEAAFIGGWGVMQEAYRRRGVPPDAIKIILSSITKSTIKQYDSAIKLWWQFCGDAHICMYSPSVLELLQFFTKCFDEGKRYGSLNNIRAAINLIVHPNLTADNRIKRFFKGALNLRPLKPKYSYTWDPEIVISYLESFYPYKNVSLKDISFKLVTLLALSTGHRVQTLSLIHIHNIKMTQGKYEIKVPDRIKTTNRNEYQPIFYIEKHTSPKRCISILLKHYLEVTQSHRGNNSTLFLTFKKPYKPASPQTLSRWIKTVMNNSGIDTKKFTAHSTRHASTSAAYRKGVDINIIKQSAGWTKKSKVFSLFYNKPLLDDRTTFANAVTNNS
ncbi:uncharacterized protein LOC126749306 [Anthonomus grandis grandis]|uniref:uncharacterized protein LOC126749306 n=1 Tax=Anthonomus grandis grandis TaxID=2921223 RepID=UPI0021656B0C|nr:uncharacterized protein LOC126749306 [Anthonomus grandis grandis]